MNYLVLAFEFAKTGLFAIGGGLATVPFVMKMGQDFPEWFSPADVPNMLAVAQVLPGAVGVNLAANAGLTAARLTIPMDILGAWTAAIALIVPSIIVITIVSRMFEAFKQNLYVQAVFRTLRPTALGLLAAAGWGVLQLSLFAASDGAPWWTGIQLANCVIFAVLALGVFKLKLHPAAYIAAGAVIGIALGL
jgi:chromate transporter